jgi:hypothetical protein
MNDEELEYYTVARTLTGEYRCGGSDAIRYTVQRGETSRGIDVGYAGGVDADTKARLERFRKDIASLVATRIAEGAKYVGIDIIIEFLEPRSSNECSGFAFMYDVVESETEPWIEEA